MRPTECRDVELKRIWKRTCPILDIPSMIKLYIINSRKIIARVTLINHFISCVIQIIASSKVAKEEKQGK